MNIIKKRSKGYYRPSNNFMVVISTKHCYECLFTI